MEKLNLRGLIFNADEYFALCAWVQLHSHEARVEMPTRISQGSLLQAVLIGEILDSPADGILIVDHRKFSNSSISEAACTLGKHNKKFFATTNTLSPLTESTSLDVTPVRDLESGKTQLSLADSSNPFTENSAFLSTLEKCTPALRWLDSRVGTINSHEIPEECVDQIKRLEQMGLVYRRNNLTLGIQTQRLRRLLKRESQGMHASYIEEHFESNKSHS